jgi:enamine deaminase RidA (YjgF/YER057c/UK114 family)
LEIESKLNDLGYQLPPVRRSAVGTFIPAVRTGNLVFLSGHGPRLPEGGFLHLGKLGADLTIEQGYDCARQVMLNLLASLKEEVGDLDKVRRIVKLLCMVNSAPDFGDTPKVANGASDLLVKLYGEAGQHARSAVGMATLPSGMPVEIEMVVKSRISWPRGAHRGALWQVSRHCNRPGGHTAQTQLFRTEELASCRCHRTE